MVLPAGSLGADERRKRCGSLGADAPRTLTVTTELLLSPGGGDRMSLVGMSSSLFRMEVVEQWPIMWVDDQKRFASSIRTRTSTLNRTKFRIVIFREISL